MSTPLSSFVPKFGKYFKIFATGAALLMALQASASPPPGYTLVWSDEFSGAVGSSPNSANWVYVTGGGGFGNNELETYVSDAAHSHIIADSQATDGKALQIQATWDSTHGYQSARIDTAGKFTVKYGFIEARIRLPYGQGIWPAFWMLGTDIGSVGWPACGEADIMENIGNQAWWGRNESTLHSPNHSGANGLGAAYYLPAGQYFKDAYHLFQCEWSANKISFFVDGNLFETRTPADTGSDPWPFNAPFFLILNVAVGGSFPGSPDSSTVFPQNLLVDYIRVYTASTVSTVATPGFSLAGGTYSSAQNVTISDATSGASIRYTTDGSTPTSTTGNIYSGPVNIASTTTLKAIAYESGDNNSSVNSATYTISTGGGGGGGNCVTATTANGWQNAVMPSWTTSFTATFDATATGSNSVIALSNGAQTAYASFACLARFNPTGQIDAYNGTAYAAASSINYSPGVSYHFRMVVNVPGKTYSIYVTPAGGSELTVGLNYAFRTGSTSLNYWGVYVNPTGSGSTTVCNFSTGGGGITTYSIVASAGANGSISPSGSVPVNSGSSQTFTMTPNSAYAVSSVTVDGANVGAVTSYTFSNVTANHTISASFILPPPPLTITASAGTGGSITPSGNVSVNQGANQSFTIIPNSGFAVSSVTVDGSNVGTSNSYTFSNVQANHTISAAFQAVTYTITAGSGISPSGVIIVNQGANQTFSIALSPGSVVLVDGVSQGAITSYTFTNVQANHTIKVVSQAGGTLTGTSGNGFHSLSMTAAQTGTFTATFDASPSASPENAVVGLSKGAATAYTGMSCIARFNPSGQIDAYNGTGYAAAATINYSANVSYHFRLVVNVTAKTYSVYVTPSGGSELTVGLNYAFRSTANTFTSLDTWNLDLNATPAGCSLTASNLSP